MNLHLDKAGRFARIRAEMAALDIDVLIGTRSGTVNYIAGAYLPWRGVVVFSRDGQEAVFTFLVDHERIRHESWIGNVVAYVPRPGLDLWDLVIGHIKANGWDRGNIGIEAGHSIRIN